MPNFPAIFLATLPTGLLLVGTAAGLGASFRLMRFPDLTVEGSFLLGGATWASATLAGLGTGLASVLGTCAGAACGGVTAVLSRVFGVDRFLAGILVSAACYSIALIVLGASNVGLFNAPNAFFVGFDLGGTPLAQAAAFALVLLAAVTFFFKRTVGIRARLAAINPGLLAGVAGSPLPYLVAGLALTNAVAAASGIAFARFQGFVDVGMGQGVLIVALASLAIGEALARYLAASLVVQTVVAAALGSVAYQFVLGCALALGAPAATTKLVSAALVLSFLVVQARRGTIEERPL